nr:type II toxin-antitoxin system RelE/ParE family toxin [uncultured Dyadobacter sp.]
MVKHLYAIRWDRKALDEFKEIYVYIRKDSYQNAQKVKREILQLIGNLTSHPRRYHRDQLRLDANDDFRSFEIHKIRITYFIDTANFTVNIIRVRSVRQEPLTY